MAFRDILCTVDNDDVREVDVYTTIESHSSHCQVIHSKPTRLELWCDIYYTLFQLLVEIIIIVILFMLEEQISHDWKQLMAGICRAHSITVMFKIHAVSLTLP